MFQPMPEIPPGLLADADQDLAGAKQAIANIVEQMQMCYQSCDPAVFVIALAMSFEQSLPRAACARLAASALTVIATQDQAQP